jgi:uncharacterized protein (TIGR02246 family)
MDRQQVQAWVAAYERAWRSPGTEALAEIFTPDASYQQGPYVPPVVGLPAIARMWEETRAGPAEVFSLTSEIVAVDGDVAVVRAEVRYGDPWIMRFAADGRCRVYEEWPFWPGQPYTADGGG